MRFLLAGVLLGLLLGCAETPPLITRTPDQILDATPSPEGTLKVDIETVDNYLRGNLKAAELKLIISACTKTSEANFFCPLYLNVDKLNQAKTDRRNKQRPPPKKGPTVKIKIKNKAIENWKELRTATVNSLIRSLNRMQAKDIPIVEKQVEDEKECPNNVAIALAAYLEDNLPEKRTYEQIGNLYFKGGKCETLLPQDKETVLSRAGLFFYLSEKWDLAEWALKLASETPDVYTGRSLYWLHQTYIK
ncbi:MAG TPA: hypothetical protein PKE69_26020, partial [Pyrinomonadaceae bacterium]|nr:hypothetical protein [Pyrinomonadaceae bacterium]